MIRISQGERDASARATHLEAATRKFLVTTNERKQMSTTTNFKRIALVAVAALGLGLLSSVPAARAETSGLAVTAANGTAGLAGIRTDSTNAAAITISATLGTAATDSILVRVTEKSIGSGITPASYIRYNDSSTPSIGSSTFVDTVTAATKTALGATSQGTQGNGPMSATATTRADTAAVQVSASGTAGTIGSDGFFRISAGADNRYVSANFYVQMDSKTSTRVAGTVSYTVTAITFTSAGVLSEVSKDFTITIAASAAASLVASPTYSTSVMQEGSSFTSGSRLDSAVSALATASTTAVARIGVVLKNASDAAVARESITATITAGIIGTTAQGFGRSIVLTSAAGGETLEIRPDGTAGTALITISTPSVTFTTKQMTFYAATPTTIVATKRLNTHAVGTNSGAITVVAKDANGNIVGGDTTVYAFSDALTVISDTSTACTFDSANARHTCTLTGVAAGTANVTIGTVSKTVVSSAVAVLVSNSPPVALKMEWNKATYVPGEKAYLKVWAVDAAGKPVAPQTIPNLYSAIGITTTTGFTGAGTPELPTSTASVALAKTSTSSNGLESLEPIKLYTVYMPSSGGTVTVTATGGASLPSAGQVAVSATATVTDNAAAALAAVTALATTVASLKTLITTLTNLVLKIQKKVKA